MNIAHSLLKSALVIASIMAAGYTWAYNSTDTIQISVTGQIVSPVCQVDVKQNVELGDVARQDIYIPGANSATTLVMLNLSQCGPQLTQATATFTGNPYTADPAFGSAIYANEISSGAQDVGLQLFNLDGKALVNLANGVTYSIPINSEKSTASLPIGARMYTPHGTPTAGEFQASVTISFTYQ